VGNPKVYIDACCFIEMAAHKVGTHKQDREDDIAIFSRQLHDCRPGTQGYPI
jgi:hypothetical protein